MNKKLLLVLTLAIAGETMPRGGGHGGGHGGGGHGGGGGNKGWGKKRD